MLNLNKLSSEIFETFEYKSDMVVYYECYGANGKVISTCTGMITAIDNHTPNEIYVIVCNLLDYSVYEIAINNFFYDKDVLLPLGWTSVDIE